MVVMMPKPKKPAPEYIKRANKAVGRTVMPKKDIAVGRVLTPSEARKEQLKKNKKSLKGGYSGANKV